MRGDAVKRATGFEHRIHGSKEKASFQVIVLGSSGGPREDTITGLLVRAPQSEWRKSSIIAVDAGAHLASMIRVLEEDMPMNSAKVPPPGYSNVLENGPFAGVRFPHISAKANALYIFRELLHSFLITHPHLDHLSGMGINTPALEYGREAKAIVALPSAIEAIKTHIFNDSIWPNLSDEGHGVGFVTYRRLIEGGNPRLGLGESRGYVTVCEGLATKCWGVSHGKCHRRLQVASHGRGDSFGFNSGGGGYDFPTRRLSRISDDHGYFSAIAQQHNQSVHPHQQSMPQLPGTPSGMPAPLSAIDKDHMWEPVNSSAFFIRNDLTGHELLVFGDTEPDSISMAPRNHIVWDDAAPKIAKGTLKAIFIECSYDDSVRDADIYGHLCPRHLIAELTFLANRVVAFHAAKNLEGFGEKGSPYAGMDLQEPPTAAELKRKRKRPNGELATNPDLPPLPASPILRAEHVGNRSVSNSRRKTSHPNTVPSTTSPLQRAVEFDGPMSDNRPITPSRRQGPPHYWTTGSPDTQAQPPLMNSMQQQPLLQHLQPKLSEPLKGLTVHIIHIKDTLADGPTPGEIIAGQLKVQAAEAGLGCQFDITSCGESIWV